MPNNYKLQYPAISPSSFNVPSFAMYAYKDPMFALGQLLGEAWNNQYNQRGVDKGVAATSGLDDMHGNGISNDTQAFSAPQLESGAGDNGQQAADFQSALANDKNKLTYDPNTRQITYQAPAFIPALYSKNNAINYAHPTSFADFVNTNQGDVNGSGLIDMSKLATLSGNDAKTQPVLSNEGVDGTSSDTSIPAPSTITTDGQMPDLSNFISGGVTSDLSKNTDLQQQISDLSAINHAPTESQPIATDSGSAYKNSGPITSQGGPITEQQPIASNQNGVIQPLGSQQQLSPQQAQKAQTILNAMQSTNQTNTSSTPATSEVQLNPQTGQQVYPNTKGDPLTAEQQAEKGDIPIMDKNTAANAIQQNNANNTAVNSHFQAGQPISDIQYTPQPFSSAKWVSDATAKMHSMGMPQNQIDEVINRLKPDADLKEQQYDQYMSNKIVPAYQAAVAKGDYPTANVLASQLMQYNPTLGAQYVKTGPTALNYYNTNDARQRAETAQQYKQSNMKMQHGYTTEDIYNNGKVREALQNNAHQNKLSEMQTAQNFQYALTKLKLETQEKLGIIRANNKGSNGGNGQTISNAMSIVKAYDNPDTPDEEKKDLAAAYAPAKDVIDNYGLVPLTSNNNYNDAMEWITDRLDRNKALGNPYSKDAMQNLISNNLEPHTAQSIINDVNWDDYF
ncbi:hypothetical protein NXG27_00825 [Megasphaera paucivorans]|uniref:Uncharacterized protein n=1 Tax=Megasphaera paucivorans TaxID=349095 RepID=A0A1G9QC78_9FIRM|nr:hypothetical protein [Megasphaera paucivorans]SDM07975.1 hypothetical protein SAMN05660299_00167 [Megasphaera paucivorans]